MVKISANKDRDVYKDFIKYSVATVLLCGLSFFSGFFGSVTAFFAVTPSILFYLHHRRILPAAYIVLTTALVLTGLAGVSGGLYYTYEFGALNVFLLIMLSKESDFVTVVFRSSLFAFITIFVVAGSLSAYFGVSLHDVVASVIDASVEKTIGMYSSVDLPADQRAELMKLYGAISELFKKIYPALLFVGFEAMATLNLITVKKYFIKDTDRIDTDGVLSWKPDEKWIFGLIGFGFLFFVKNDIAHLAALNGLIVFLAFYFFIGFCIISYFFKVKKVSGFMQGIIYFTMIFVNEFKFVVIAVGAFDIWFDFRKRINKVNKA